MKKFLKMRERNATINQKFQTGFFFDIYVTKLEMSDLLFRRKSFMLQMLNVDDVQIGILNKKWWVATSSILNEFQIILFISSQITFCAK